MDKKKYFQLNEYCWVMSPNHTIGSWALAESVSSPSPRKNIFSDKLNTDWV